MTATLTIKAEAAGAVSVLEGVNRLIDGSVKASERLAAVSATIAGHWKRAADEVAGLTKQVKSATAESINLGAASKNVGSNIQSSVAAAQNLARALRDAAVAAAAVNIGGFSSAGGSYPLALRGSSALAMRGSTGLSTTGRRSFADDAIDVPFTVNGGGGGRGGGRGGSSGGGGGFFSDRNRSTYGEGFADLGVTKFAGDAVSKVSSLIETGIGRSLRFVWREFEMAGKAAALVVAGLIGNSIRLALESQPIADAFKNLVGAGGLGSEADVLRDLQEAAKGTVSQLSLMESANKALMLGAASTTEELQLLIEGGRRMGKAMGVDAKEGFEVLATGIGRQSARVLDDVGIKIKANEVYENYAKSVKATTDDLSEEEKQLAFVSAAFEGLRKYQRTQGEEQESTSEKIQRTKAAFSDLSVEFGNRFLPAIGEVADRWTSFIKSLSADELESGMKSAIEATKTLAKSTSEDLSGLMGSVWQAFTNPSKAAFEIVGKRFEILWNDITAKWKSFWIEIVDGIAAIPSAIVYSVGAAFKAVGMDKLGTSMQMKAGEYASQLDDEIQKPKVDAKRANKKLESEIKSLQEKANYGTPQGPAAYYGSLAKAGGPTESGMTTAAKQAEATARREAQQAIEKAEKESKDAAREALQKEIRAREDVIRQIERENSAIEDRMRDLDAARTNANAALAGFDDPNKTVASRLNDLSSELRKYPDTFKRIGDRIAENGDQMADAMKQWDDELTKTLADLNRGIQRQAQSFLQEGPQDGESVRVRSLKRRAQKEQRQYNNDLINGAFRSPSLDSIGGDFGGFGAQNTERNPRVLNQRFPGLERALLGLRGNDGTTQLQQVQEHVNEVVQQHLEELKKARQQQGELFKEQANAHAEQKKTQTEITNLLKLASSNYAELAQTSAANAKEIQSIKREMEKTAQQVRSLK